VTTGGAVLAVDASSARPCVALLGPADERWGLWEQQPPARGTARLGAAAAELLAARGLRPADLLGFAVGTGPGSYTGLRAAIALARGLAFAAGRPLAGVPSVEAAARSVLRERSDADEVVVVIDARRGECYRADYGRAADGVVERGPPRLAPVAEVEALDAERVSGRIVVREPFPDGYDVAGLGRRRLAAGGDDPASVLPLYLKRSHAELAFEQRSERR